MNLHRAAMILKGHTRKDRPTSENIARAAAATGIDEDVFWAAIESPSHRAERRRERDARKDLY